MMRSEFKAVLLAAAMLSVAPASQAGESFWDWAINPWRQKEVRPVDNQNYQKECSDCHYAYPPGLLPSKSWEKLLTADALSDHFGDDASLDEDTLKEIRAYALENAADKSYYKRSRKIALATEGVEPPLRITEVRYIKRKHHDIPEKMIKGNKDVKSLSQCNACHTKAKEGIFDNDTVKIPNFPDWKD